MNKLSKLLKLCLSSILIISVFTVIFYQYDYTHYDGYTKEEDEEDKLLNRIYFTITTFSSTGYGDVSPGTRPVKIFSMILQFLLIITVVGSIVD
tara:strand:- start:211 stop:492 length:282 start_codon:yes stop_codon:yes gene_type:complete